MSFHWHKRIRKISWIPGLILRIPKIPTSRPSFSVARAISSIKRPIILYSSSNFIKTTRNTISITRRRASSSWIFKLISFSKAKTGFATISKGTWQSCELPTYAKPSWGKSFSSWKLAVWGSKFKNS